MKTLTLKISKCIDCPYHEYYDDDNPRVEGHYCYYGDNARQIIGSENTYQYKMQLSRYEQSQNTLFPIKEKPIDPFVIPDWCPLPDVG